MQKVFCLESLFLFQLYSHLDISPSFFEKKEPLTPLRFAHVS